MIHNQNKSFTKVFTLCYRLWSLVWFYFLYFIKKKMQIIIHQNDFTVYSSLKNGELKTIYRRTIGLRTNTDYLNMTLQP